MIITKTFDLGLENYKANLQKEIEEHKSHLAQITLEYQVKFLKLHESRAEIIKILYSKVIKLEKCLIRSTTIAQGPEYINDTQRDNDSIEKLRDLINQLDQDRVFFPLKQ